MELSEKDKVKDVKGVSNPAIYRALLKMGYGKDCIDAKMDKMRKPNGTMLLFKTSAEFWNDYYNLLNNHKK